MFVTMIRSIVYARFFAVIWHPCQIVHAPVELNALQDHPVQDLPPASSGMSAPVGAFMCFRRRSRTTWPHLFHLIVRGRGLAWASSRLKDQQDSPPTGFKAAKGLDKKTDQFNCGSSGPLLRFAFVHTQWCH